MAEVSAIFEKTYHNYLKEVTQCNFRPYQACLGVRCDDNRVIVPFFGKNFAVSPAGIFSDDRDGTTKFPGFAASVALCKYLLMGVSLPDISQDNRWASYKDFKDAAPLLNYFRHNVEQAISACFSGRLPDLESAVLKLGGRNMADNLPFDLKMRLDPLPRVPLFLLFNDADAEFPAECRVLFERRAEAYLDMESLAIVGALTADYLRKASYGEETN